MTISLPFRSPELDYTVHILFGHLLGLHYQTCITPENKHVAIGLKNGKSLEIAVGEWLAQPEYKAANLPTNLRWFTKKDNPFLSENDLPVLYGAPELEIGSERVSIQADLFSAVFFMLSRWEEAVSTSRDKYGRFPASAAYSVNAGYYQRPVVDEYAEMLWNMLVFLGVDQDRKQWSFRFIPTHDIDNPRKWRGLHTLLRTLGGDLIKRRRVGAARRSWRSFWRTWNGKENDPYDTFDYLMDCSERHGLQSHFFFHCGGNHPLDREALPPSHPIVRQILEKIDARGHSIGFHPSYEAHTNEERFNEELELLRQHSPQEIKCGRQHFLRFEVPITWRLWADAGLAWDSTMVYPEEAGFRCGTCREFPVFDIGQRKMLSIQEVPLTLMETSWMRYNPKPPDRFLGDARQLLGIVKKYRGTFVLLWHNSTLGFSHQDEARRLYEEILSLAAGDPC